jgi:uncharacterized protein YoaH (UPF0181 family)
MNNLGLSKDEIIQKLEDKGIISGEAISANNLRDAIATVISENNKAIEEKLKKILLWNEK